MGRSLTGRGTAPHRKRDDHSQEKGCSLTGRGNVPLVSGQSDVSSQAIRHTCHGGTAVNKIRYELLLEGINAVRGATRGV